METVIELQNPRYDLFITPPSENLSEASNSAYKRDREDYLTFCQSKGLSIGDTSSLKVYQKHLMDSGLRPTTVNRKVCGVKTGLVGYLEAVFGKEKAEALKPAYKVVKAIKLSKNEKAIRAESVLSEEEIARLIEAADPKIGCIILFLSKTGCRISEALNITFKDVSERAEAVSFVVIGKGKKARTVFLSIHDYQRIKESFQGQKYLFETIHGNRYDKVNVTKSISRLSERVLGKHKSAHCFRHSFVTNKIRQTRKIQAVSSYAPCVRIDGASSGKDLSGWAKPTS